jgi:hypothetical protein
MDDDTPAKTPPSLTALRYVQPLREGGSLPAIVETEEDGLFVVKFRGAGQGPRALIAELIVGGLADAVGLRVPDLAIINVPPAFGRGEPDPEIQDLLRASHGVNIGIRYLDGAFNFDPNAAGDLVPPDFASTLVWLDAFVTNPDRTARNPNLMVCNRRLWLIDHGAALYAHHDWPAVDETRTRTPFAPISQHVFLDRADAVEALDEALAARLDSDVLARVLAGVPDALLTDPLAGFADAGAARERYVRYLSERLAGPRAFVGEAAKAREKLLSDPPKPRRARR